MHGTLEKTIQGLEHCRDIGDGHCYEENCPYHQGECEPGLKADALFHLKKRKPKAVKSEMYVGDHLMGKCPYCKKVLTVQEHPKFYGLCGQAVVWP